MAHRRVRAPKPGGVWCRSGSFYTHILYTYVGIYLNIAKKITFFTFTLNSRVRCNNTTCTANEIVYRSCGAYAFIRRAANQKNKYNCEKYEQKN